jgi:ectoine hydroxylase-related dioxygenase (phytanoyl-CoA dioxygenase family)
LVGKGRVNGGSIDVDFSDDTLYAPYTRENRSDGVRTAISNQYCEPWARPQEKFFLSIPKEKVARMSPLLQSMLSYSVHPPFMGQVTGRHPRKVLDPGFVNPLED